jgi:hypothetical protein
MGSAAGRRFTVNLEATKPGNPEECRQHALEYVRLAQTSVTPQGRDHFAKLARTWIMLAEDLERNGAFLDDDETETWKQTG